MLWRAHRTGAVVAMSSLHPAVKVRVDHLEEILATLSGAGWIARSGADGWLLSRDAVAIKIDDVYRLFVFNPARARAGAPCQRRARLLVYEIRRASAATCKCRSSSYSRKPNLPLHPARPHGITAV